MLMQWHGDTARCNQTKEGGWVEALLLRKLAPSSCFTLVESFSLGTAIYSIMR